MTQNIHPYVAPSEPKSKPGSEPREKKHIRCSLSLPAFQNILCALWIFTALFNSALIVANESDESQSRPAEKFAMPHSLWTTPDSLGRSQNWMIEWKGAQGLINDSFCIKPWTIAIIGSEHPNFPHTAWLIFIERYILSPMATSAQHEFLNTPKLLRARLHCYGLKEFISAMRTKWGVAGSQQYPPPFDTLEYRLANLRLLECDLSPDGESPCPLLPPWATTPAVPDPTPQPPVQPPPVVPPQPAPLRICPTGRTVSNDDDCSHAFTSIFLNYASDFHKCSRRSLYLTCDYEFSGTASLPRTGVSDVRVQLTFERTSSASRSTLHNLPYNNLEVALRRQAADKWNRRRSFRNRDHPLIQRLSTVSCHRVNQNSRCSGYCRLWINYPRDC